MPAPAVLDWDGEAAPSHQYHPSQLPASEAAIPALAHVMKANSAAETGSAVYQAEARRVERLPVEVQIQAQPQQLVRRRMHPAQ